MRPSSLIRQPFKFVLNSITALTSHLAVLKSFDMNLKILPDIFGVLKLEPPQPFPVWLSETAVFFLAQTVDEYSIICPRNVIPEALPFDDDWWCIRADGDLAFDQVGVAASLSTPLAEAGLSIILVGTHDRDYIFVKDLDLAKAIEFYEEKGFSIA